MSGYNLNNIDENTRGSMLYLMHRFLHPDVYSYSATEIDTPSKYAGIGKPIVDLNKLYKSYACPDYFSSDKDLKMFRAQRSFFANSMIAYRSPSYRNYTTLNATLRAITKLEKEENKDTLYLRSKQGFASFMLWYSKYANLNAYDSYNINRLALFIEEPKYNRPDPLYLTFYPAAKTLVNHIIILPFIPFVETGLIVNSVYQANKYQNPYIVARKLLNTGSVIFNNIVLLQIPNIVGFAYAFVVQSIPFTFETANDGGKVSRPNYAISNFVAGVYNAIKNKLSIIIDKVKSVFARPVKDGNTLVDTSEASPEVYITQKQSFGSERMDSTSRATSRSTSFSPYTPKFQGIAEKNQDELAIKDSTEEADSKKAPNTTVDQKIASAEKEVDALKSLSPKEQAEIKKQKLKPTDYKMV